MLEKWKKLTLKVSSTQRRLLGVLFLSFLVFALIVYHSQVRQTSKVRKAPLSSAELSAQIEKAGWASEAVFRANNFSPVPLAFISTPNHQIDLSYNVEKDQSQLVIDESIGESLTFDGLPLKVIETPQSELVVIGRNNFSGFLWLKSIDLLSGEQQKISVPELLGETIFRQAFTIKDDIFLILYQVKDKKNYLYKFNREDKNFNFDANSVTELFFGGRYELGNNILVTSTESGTYICSAHTCYFQAKGLSSLTRLEFPEDLKIIELTSDTSQIAGLFQDDLIEPKRAFWETKDRPFKIYDIQSQTLIPQRKEGIPYRLAIENGQIEYSFLESPEDLVRIFFFDWSNSDAGLGNLGMNNFEGRVAWSQVYYLQAFIDILKTWNNDKIDFTFLSNLKVAIKSRLDVEMAALDKLLESEEGLTSLRYSINREPAIYAVQTGRILRLMKRYVSEVDNSIALKNYPSFKEQVETLSGHIEKFEISDEKDPWLTPDTIYLKWPRGSVFPFDGLGIPYNHQNDWVSGVMADLPPEKSSTTYATAAKDIVNILLELENFTENPPEDYQWHYWWGQAKTGWNAEENISINTPEYPGDTSLAHISYRTIDATAILTVAKTFPEILPASLLDYFVAAVENDGLYLFLSEELAHYDRKPHISESLAAQYLRMDSPWTLQNAIWAYESFYSKNK